jgi:hypothetical protein
MSHMSSYHMNLVRVSLYLYQIIPVFFVSYHMNLVRVSLYLHQIIPVFLVFLHVFIGFLLLNLLLICSNLNTHSHIGLFRNAMLENHLQKTIFTVFANASPSLLTYPVSPAYCFPRLISVYWSKIFGF